MQPAELAARLVDASNAQQQALLRENSSLADVALAYALKEICWDAWTVEPTRSKKAASALEALAKINDQPEVCGLADWVIGIAALVEGRLEKAITQLDAANTTFLSIGKEEVAAATRVSKLIALSLLGRYDEAIECGLRAREVFLAHNDLLAAGKVEHNIGNLFFRRDRYSDAEIFQSAAREKFTTVDNQRQLATINNCLANTRALLHQFTSAEELYNQAVGQAERAGMPVTLAEIEGNIGNFALLQGKYDRALDYLERSRRRYTSLGMAHLSATAEHEIADAYLELNLPLEATALYKQIIPIFSEHGMRAEQARALAYCGRAAVLLGSPEEAASLFGQALSLYRMEGNEVGAAVVRLSQAQLCHVQHDYGQACTLAAEAQPPFRESGSWQRFLLARWLEADAQRAQGNAQGAEELLQTTLADAQRHNQPQIVARCQTSLGLLAERTGELRLAETYFRQAIDVVEALRAPLPGEEFRTSFFSDKLVPYHGLVRLCLNAGRIGDALEFVEAARSRTLAEMVGGRLQMQHEARDEFETDLMSQAENLSAELSYLYNQLNRPIRGQSMPSTSELDRLQKEQQQRERKLLEITRQLRHREAAVNPQTRAFSVESIQRMLGPDAALVEYTSIDDELVAFLITSEGLDVFRGLGQETDLTTEIEQFRFQIDTLRFGAPQLQNRMQLLTARIVAHLRSLHDKLLRPIEAQIGQRRLAIVPHRALHYLPFHALHDGQSFLIERREVSYAASASVLLETLRQTAAAYDNAVLFGVADEAIPRVRDEILAISQVFSEAKLFVDKEASVAMLRRYAPTADVLHLACHAHFRADNPMFSSLRLGDGWLTARDASRLQFHGALVTLSACVTGVNAVAPGDELIGLARGFFAAGSPSVLISLWMVDDEATAGLMTDFYAELRKTGSPSQALRTAQVRMIQNHPHPFFWSPFALVGRW